MPLGTGAGGVSECACIRLNPSLVKNEAVVQCRGGLQFIINMRSCCVHSWRGWVRRWGCHLLRASPQNCSDYQTVIQDRAVVVTTTSAQGYWRLLVARRSCTPVRGSGVHHHQAQPSGLGHEIGLGKPVVACRSHCRCHAAPAYQCHSPDQSQPRACPVVHSWNVWCCVQATQCRYTLQFHSPP
jgi:hypothetical protein